MPDKWKCMIDLDYPVIENVKVCTCSVQILVFLFTNTAGELYPISPFLIILGFSRQFISFSIVSFCLSFMTYQWTKNDLTMGNDHLIDLFVLVAMCSGICHSSSVCLCIASGHSILSIILSGMYVWFCIVGMLSLKFYHGKEQMLDLQSRCATVWQLISMLSIFLTLTVLFFASNCTTTR